MLIYVVRRLLLMLVTIVGVMTILFALQKFAGDPTLFLLPADATEKDRLDLLHQLGLDRPLLAQYGTFIGHALSGNLGLSWQYQQPALPIVLGAFPATLALTFCALGFGVLFAVPLGVAAATHRDSPLDTFASGFAVIGLATPVYWSGLLGILLFSSTLRWLPPMGAQGASALVLPSLVLGMSAMARIMRITRSAMIDVLGQDFVRTVKAKGLPRRTVLFKHALRNASVPIVSMIGLELGGLLGGAILVETVFSWPGIGRMAVNAVYARDFPVVQAVVFVVAISFSAVNVLVDLLSAALNPQIRLD